MKQSDARRAEREARADVATHDRSGPGREEALARYLSAFAYQEARQPDHPDQPKQAEQELVELAG